MFCNVLNRSLGAVRPIYFFQSDVKPNLIAVCLKPTRGTRVEKSLNTWSCWPETLKCFFSEYHAFSATLVHCRRVSSILGDSRALSTSIVHSRRLSCALGNSPKFHYWPHWCKHCRFYLYRSTATFSNDYSPIIKQCTHNCSLPGTVNLVSPDP